MFTYVCYFRFCFIFCFSVQILSLNSRVEAQTYGYTNCEYNFDANAINNCHTLDDKIDCFIDAGMQYQQTTSKKFKYKKFLKEAYKHLDEHNIKVDKKLKKDIEKRVQNRITERFFKHDKKFESNHILGYCKEIATTHNPNGDYPNGFREAIVEIGTGAVMLASEIPPVQVVGGGLVVSGIIKLSSETINYVWPTNHERNRPRERDRDGERPSLSDRERDRERDR